MLRCLSVVTLWSRLTIPVLQLHSPALAWRTCLESAERHPTPTKITCQLDIDLKFGTRAQPGRCLTLARTGGLVQPLLRFFADSEKTVARSAAGFWATLWGKPCAIFGEKNLTGSGQVTEL